MHLCLVDFLFYKTCIICLQTIKLFQIFHGGCIHKGLADMTCGNDKDLPVCIVVFSFCRRLFRA